MAAEQEIKFYSTRDKVYGYMSNFYKSPIDLDGRMWPTTEHYFQAMKFTDPQYQEAIRTSGSASNAATLGRKRHSSFRNDWDTARDEVMFTALKAKFTQHQDLKEKLLSTGDAILIEDSPTDYYWGIGKDGTGQNKLGQQLGEIRSWLRSLAE